MLLLKASDFSFVSVFVSSNWYFYKPLFVISRGRQKSIECCPARERERTKCEFCWLTNHKINKSADLKLFLTIKIGLNANLNCELPCCGAGVLLLEYCGWQPLSQVSKLTIFSCWLLQRTRDTTNKNWSPVRFVISGFHCMCLET